MSQGCARLFLVLYTLLLVFVSISRFTTTTPAGRHCPTAAIQVVAISEFGSGRSSETRKVVEGDKEFVQCDCAEKRAAESSSPARQEAGPAAQPFLFVVSDEGNDILFEQLDCRYGAVDANTPCDSLNPVPAPRPPNA